MGEKRGGKDGGVKPQLLAGRFGAAVVGIGGAGAQFAHAVDFPAAHQALSLAIFRKTLVQLGDERFGLVEFIERHVIIRQAHLRADMLGFDALRPKVAFSRPARPAPGRFHIPGLTDQIGIARGHIAQLFETLLRPFEVVAEEPRLGRRDLGHKAPPVGAGRAAPSRADPDRFPFGQPVDQGQGRVEIFQLDVGVEKGVLSGKVSGLCRDHLQVEIARLFRPAQIEIGVGSGLPGERRDLHAVGDQTFIFGHGLFHVHPVAQRCQSVEASLADQRRIGFNGGIEGGEVFVEERQRPVGGGEALGFAGRLDRPPANLVGGAVGAQGRQDRAVRLGGIRFGLSDGQMGGAETVERLQADLSGGDVIGSQREQPLAVVELRRKIPLPSSEVEPRFQHFRLLRMGCTQVCDQGCSLDITSPVGQRVGLADSEGGVFRKAGSGPGIKNDGLGVAPEITQGSADRFQDIGRRFIQGDAARQFRRFGIFLGPAEHNQGV